jgi:adenosine deaminase/aminodeoxyfutalosine deaminase
MDAFLSQLPKAELHVHLEGSLEPETLLELDPSLNLQEIRRRYRYHSFTDFIDAFKWVVSHLRSPDDYALATTRLLRRLASENVRYAEVTLSAGVMLWRGQPFPAIYEAVTRAAACSAVEVYWILDCVRQFGLDAAWPVARLAAERAQDRVVAFGVGGDEHSAPVEIFEPVFQFALQHGLRLTPHAGETAGPESVWGAVRLGAHRIGHGVGAAGDPELVRFLRDNNIPLEICLSSNAATGAVPSLAVHPVRRLFDAGVPIVLNTDDPAMFHTTLSREYQLARDLFGFTNAELRTLSANSFRYAFRCEAMPVFPPIAP